MKGHRAPVEIAPFRGSHAELLPLFAEADDSPAEIRKYIDLGEVLVARRAQRVIGEVLLIGRRRLRDQISRRTRAGAR
jgi:hypothetical protein